MFRLNPAAGVPVYLQLKEQVKHAIAIGALRPGDQLPTVRKLAEQLVINPNTVVRTYRELQHEGIVELKQGSGAFIRDSPTAATRVTRKAQQLVASAVDRLTTEGLGEHEIRRLFESELAARAGRLMEQ
jgi:GntR family transcriptional regulator